MEVGRIYRYSLTRNNASMMRFYFDLKKQRSLAVSRRGSRLYIFLWFMFRRNVFVISLSDYNRILQCLPSSVN